jgi:hypothetical protein
MKNIFLLVLSVFLVSCSDDGVATNDEITVDSIYGVWEWAYSYNENADGEGEGGLNSSWLPVSPTFPNIFTITINEDGAFINTRRGGDCTEGTFTIDNNLLTFQFENCPGRRGQTTITEEFHFEDGYLVLIPTYYSCIHGCGNKFRKISSGR